MNDDNGFLGVSQNPNDCFIHSPKNQVVTIGQNESNKEGNVVRRYKLMSTELVAFATSGLHN
jgi:hypothetical protein